MGNGKINKAHRSSCPLTGMLELLGDKWSLVILRDIMAGKHKYREFQASPEGIPTNILASRLNRLLEEGVITKKPYQQRPVRYAYYLTRKGADLLPVIQQAAYWGLRYIPGCESPPEWFFKDTPDDLMAKED
jgi:DNA-binding HxlR family transcriptional regulator